ncbi:hypothetical protein AB5J72_47695 [Streptomyces sp. CG1]|uniref:hypothetical protein n=1 Tax=Streptomyces sp. CG1 TaxID=1287523 RepID=UPI0034E24158
MPQQCLRGFELRGQGAEGVGEDVVDLAGEPGALVQDGGLGLGLLGAAGLFQQRLGLVGALDVAETDEARPQTGTR